MPLIDELKRQKRTLIDKYARPDNLKGFAQVVTTLAPLAALWYLAVATAGISYWLTAGATLLMTLFLLRAFVLMHECGHGSLFRGPRLNQAVGFILGVVSGMPQYVWSQHHHYHHCTNGNWEKYRGPLCVATVDEFAAMTPAQQRRYQYARSLWIGPIAGFMYLIFNPRINWLRGSMGLVAHVLVGTVARPGVSIKTRVAEFQTPYWASATEYGHMFWNNVVLLSLWAVMSWSVGAGLFFAVYIVSVSLAGAVGIVLFTVQHNFEHAYASGNDGWDYDVAAIHGTSFLSFPRWLNWFTANIGYHHVHHLSAKIPNYRLAGCHEEYRRLFRDVARFSVGDIPRALKCILWDTRARRIVSVAEYRREGLLEVASRKY